MLNITTTISEQKIHSTGRSYCMKVYSLDTVAHYNTVFNTNNTSEQLQHTDGSHYYEL